MYRELERWVEVPRTLGDPSRDEGIDTIVSTLEEQGATVVRQPFNALDPATGDTYALQNIYASTHPNAQHHLILATHFDVRPWAEEDADPTRRDHPIPGANDGTSGLVILLALVPALARTLPSDVGLTIALFDGEELGRPRHGGYCAGSRWLAAHVDNSPAFVREASLGIVLDMVGDADLEILLDPRSVEQNPALVDDTWEIAKRIGAPFSPRKGQDLLDDHVYLSRAGIPSILLIDYTYPAWHTHADDSSRVSGHSLAQVAEVVFETLEAQASKLSAEASSLE